jgi:hypothetical protein
MHRIGGKMAKTKKQPEIRWDLSFHGETEKPSPPMCRFQARKDASRRRRVARGRR